MHFFYGSLGLMAYKPITMPNPSEAKPLQSVAKQMSQKYLPFLST